MTPPPLTWPRARVQSVSAQRAATASKPAMGTWNTPSVTVPSWYQWSVWDLELAISTSCPPGKEPPDRSRMPSIPAGAGQKAAVRGRPAPVMGSWPSMGRQLGVVFAMVKTLLII